MEAFKSLDTINDGFVADKPQKQLLNLSWDDYKWPLAFLLSMSMVGLSFPLGYIGLLVVLVNRFKRDRYDFIIMFTIFSGCYAMMGNEDLPFKPMDLAFFISIIGFLVYKKSKVVRKIFVLLLLYALVLFLIAKTSEETMGVQIKRMRGYLMMFYVFIPLMAFSGREFDIKIFFRRVFVYMLILCAFYVLDGFILNGYILIPNSYTDEAGTVSTFTNIYWYLFPRKYPPGLFIMCLCLFPVMKYYKLTTKQWILICLALATTRTMTFIFGMIITYVIFQGHFKKVMKYLCGALIAIVALYYIDGAMGGFLRVQSTFEQFVSLDAAQDEEDLAEFGSGRIAQTIPKFEVLYDLDREWLGLGFLHPELTTNPKFWVKNEFYSDVTKADEVATGVEITQLQTILDIGYLGLIIQFVFYILLYYVIRHLKYAKYYLVVFAIISFWGLGGFAGLNTHLGLFFLALSLAVILLSDEKRHLDLGLISENS